MRRTRHTGRSHAPRRRRTVTSRCRSRRIRRRTRSRPSWPRSRRRYDGLSLDLTLSVDTRAVRAAVYSTFAREGRPPSPAELAGSLGLGSEAVAGALRELHDMHAVVLTPSGDAIRMAHPFSAWPMGFVVRSGDRFWW